MHVYRVVISNANLLIILVLQPEIYVSRNSYFTSLVYASTFLHPRQVTALFS